MQNTLIRRPPQLGVFDKCWSSHISYLTLTCANSHILALSYFHTLILSYSHITYLKLGREIEGGNFYFDHGSDAPKPGADTYLTYLFTLLAYLLTYLLCEVCTNAYKYTPIHTQ